MSRVVTIKHPSGAEIVVCASHHLQVCHKCCMMFDEENKQSIIDFKRQNNSKTPVGKSLGKGLLLSGTNVRRPDHSGNNPPNHFDGVVTGVITSMDEGSMWCGMESFGLSN